MLGAAQPYKQYGQLSMAGKFIQKNQIKILLLDSLGKRNLKWTGHWFLFH